MKKEITAFHIKIIAVICMFIDHLNSIVLNLFYIMAMNMNNGFGQFIKDNIVSLQNFQTVLHTIGRLAFPLYIFMLIQGFMRTRNVLKYAFRLFVFALISEIPFNCAFFGTYFYPSYNNVFITLLFGLITVYLISILEKLTDNLKHFVKILIRILGIICIVLTFSYMAEISMCDYGASGIIAITVAYLFKDKPLVSYGLCVLALVTINGSIHTLFALTGLALIYRYKGNKGKSAKYFFYSFYPAHLLLLGICAQILEYNTF